MVNFLVCSDRGCSVSCHARYRCDRADVDDRALRLWTAFSVLTFYFFARGVRENRVYFSLVAAGFYALTCWSKELYVPIIAILSYCRKAIGKYAFVIPGSQ